MQSGRYLYTLYRVQDREVEEMRAVPGVLSQPANAFALNATIFASGGQVAGPLLLPGGPECAAVSFGGMVNATWGLCLVPLTGWVASWRDPMIALVVMGAFALSCEGGRGGRDAGGLME